MKEKLQTTIDQRMNDLRRMRDELKVKATLAKADARDAWNALETRFNALEHKIKVKVDLEKDAVKNEFSAAIDELETAYKRLKLDAMRGDSEKTERRDSAR